MVGNAVKNFGIVADLQPKFIAFEFSRTLRNKQHMISIFLINSIKRINSVLQNHLTNRLTPTVLYAVPLRSTLYKAAG